MMDFIAYVIGPPIFPSYVPRNTIKAPEYLFPGNLSISAMMMAATDNMNFLERTKSFMGHAVMYVTWPM